MGRNTNNKIDKNMNLEQIKINAILAADPEGIQIDGNHYQGDSIPLYQFLNQNNVNTMDGYAIKYAFRHRRKNKERDIAKAIHTLQLILKDEYNMYMLGGQLYTKEQYDELLSQAKKEAEGKETETTVTHTDRGISIESESKKVSNRNVYVRKINEVKAVYVSREGNFEKEISDIGLHIYGYGSNRCVYFRDREERDVCVLYGNYVVLSGDGLYHIMNKANFDYMYEPKL